MTSANCCSLIPAGGVLPESLDECSQSRAYGHRSTEKWSRMGSLAMAFRKNRRDSQHRHVLDAMGLGTLRTASLSAGAAPGEASRNNQGGLSSYASSRSTGRFENLDFLDVPARAWAFPRAHAPCATHGSEYRQKAKREAKQRAVPVRRDLDDREARRMDGDGKGRREAVSGGATRSARSPLPRRAPAESARRFAARLSRRFSFLTT